MAKKEKNLNLVKETVLSDGEIIQHSIYGAYETKSLGNDTVKNGILVAIKKNYFLCKTF